MRRLLAAVILSFVAVGVGPIAHELPLPSGPVVLTVSGRIASTNVDGKAMFDLAMLDGLEQHTTITETPWHDGTQRFSGVLISSLLKAIGARGSEVTVTALNAYFADIPMTDFSHDPVILASRINGELLSVRDKGPLFVIYPFDGNSELHNEVHFGRSVWQVTSIEVH